MDISEISFQVAQNPNSQKVALSSSASQTAAFSAVQSKGRALPVMVSPDVDCFVLRGANPSPSADGTCQIMRGGFHYRVHVMDGEKLGFITSGASGSVYLTPEA